MTSGMHRPDVKTSKMQIQIRHVSAMLRKIERDKNSRIEFHMKTSRSEKDKIDMRKMLHM